MEIVNYLNKFNNNVVLLQDDRRLKTTVVAVAPFNVKEYNKKLIKEIKQLASLS